MVKVNIDQKLKFRLTLMSLFASFVTIIFGFYMLSGLVAKVEEGKVKIAEKDRDLEIINKNTSDLQEYKGEIEKVYSTLPLDYYEVAYFTSQVEDLAQNNGLILQTSIDKEQKEEKGGFNSIMFSIKLSGSYSQITDFLSQLSKLKYFTGVDDLKMSSSDGMVDADIKFKLFVGK